MTLTRIYKIFGGFHIFFGLVLVSGLGPLPTDWVASVGIPTMAEHFGSAMMVIGYMFWMLPSWTSEDQLKTATMPLIWAQFFLFLMPIYHVVNGSIPADAGFWLQSVILIVFMVLFYRQSRA
jgi:Na+-transporting NADH:ubiquinone oxidoreductase subunit NqrB|uniref:Uncharacterized protein n=1 Tax=uncultured marine bacterium EB0_35D03 TaxID=415435 RepID=A4GHK8_9BACT|nr:hypothetical protein MBMO_EB0-35D03.0032 [uncultured marine bacterium EB0_35D03]|tara:strand:- start:115 stop:480 length:366 start_codon:yes stop_codon:yes gene_type:complete